MTTVFTKAKPWKGNDLSGIWDVTIKIDGVRAIVTDWAAMSRAGKPLYNLEGLPNGDYEIYAGSWEKTVSMVRTKEAQLVPKEFAYSLDPIDPRLLLDRRTNPTAEYITALMHERVLMFDEGLVLRQGDVWLKVKPKETYDVPITEIIPGKGKHEGKMGALMTPMGKVGTGFSDRERLEFMYTVPLGTIIEVSCMSLTPNGKFRHPAFERVRWDKA